MAQGEPVPPPPLSGRSESLGRSCRRLIAGGERAAPERYPRGPTQAAKKRGLTERSHGQSKRSGFLPTGKSTPVPGSSSLRHGLRPWVAATKHQGGRRTNPGPSRIWPWVVGRKLAPEGKPDLPRRRSGFRKERQGQVR